MGDWLGQVFQLQGTGYAALPQFLTSLGIGLLLGIERERKQDPRAGVRTFALACLFGTLSGHIASLAAWPLLPVVGLAGVVALALAAYWHPAHCASPPDSTTQIALLLAYCLGLLVQAGPAELAVALAIIATLLLYLKPELSGLSQKLTRPDILAVLQFGAVSAIILPILPNRAFGPYQAINPYEIWLMVVLISGVSLTGYVAVRLFGEKVGGPLLGLLGGMVSSTATSMSFARQVRDDAKALHLSATVIQLANLVVFVRLAILAGLLAPLALPAVLPLLGSALAGGLLATGLGHLRHGSGNGSQDGDDDGFTPHNPVEMRTALVFGGLYAVVTLAAAALMHQFGSSGLYGVALVSGVTDVDPISLSAFNQFADGHLSAGQVAATLALALLTNSLFKFGMVASLGGKALMWRTAPMFASSLGAMLLCWGWLAQRG
ncbi:hypothetical protein BXU06_07875 [Aquaspirillum sp. LM1]|uniref:MgtC/SapB family protein n=1 Tax=Aquaspirillum sp. LM1 TaxID=1938604 RepID=UPI0009838E67|nr:DUF4010 domain-containing protein [Aquaspirillum sp. LM1]AQR64991.1 hypothetical protein BXU06_07875 [Aquaspirillum sp. LM1]